jgi:hypothetical protein
MWVRATLPRMRVDQLMSYAWKVLIPISFVQIFVDGWILVYSPAAWGLWLGVASAILLGALATATYKGVQQLGRRRPRAERLAALQELTGSRSA